MPLITIHQIVAILGIVLALSVFSLFSKWGLPSKVVWGASILAILVVAVFWSVVKLGTEEDEDDE